MNGLAISAIWKALGKHKIWEEGQYNLHSWPKSWEICGCTRPF